MQSRQHADSRRRSALKTRQRNLGGPRKRLADLCEVANYAETKTKKRILAKWER